MNLLFKNRTKYTKQCYQKFLEFHNKKFGISSNLYTLLIVALIAFCFVLQLNYGNKKVASMLILVFIAFISWRIFHPVKEIQDEINSPKISQESTFVFCFYKNYFTVSDGNQMNKCYYWKLYKVFETKDYFYLYINPDYAMLVSKNGFKIGTAEDFSNFIKKKCLLKYRKQA